MLKQFMSGAIVAVFSLLIAGSCGEHSSPAKACVKSGGTVTTASCCLATDDFPNTCLIGACGCAPENSHEVEVCECPEGMCFNGTECVEQ